MKSAPQRLQKLISRAGLYSRRQAEELILAGKVKVNGKVITEFGTRADPTVDSIKVGSKRLTQPPPSSTWVFYKPTGVLCTRDANEKRKTIMDVLPKKVTRLGVVNVGRLDMNSQGLLLLTNDGELAFRLTHPKFHVPKVYEVKIRGHITPRAMKKFEKGVVMDEGGRALPAKVRTTKRLDHGSWIEIEIMEGKNRQIRKMCESLGYQVSKLKRISVGPIKLGNLKMGEVRELTPKEYISLYRTTHLTF